jgi:Flp pilus assembly protein CpaB
MPIRQPMAALVRLRWFCRSRPVLWWLACVVTLSGAAVVWTRQIEALAGQRERLVQAVPVVVAVHDLSPGEVITAADARVEPRPSAFVPAGAVSTVTDAVGQVVREPIVAGEVVVGARLANRGATGVEALLRPTERAVAVTADERTPPMEVGSFVDLIAADSAATSSASTATVLVDGARVVGVRDKSVVVAVPADDLSQVASAVARRSVVLALSGTPPRRR